MSVKMSYQVEGGDLVRAGEASSAMKTRLKKLGLPPESIRRAAICMYEGEINMVIHANGGVADVTVDLDAITLVLRDTGPGIPDVEQAMEAGYSTANTVARDLGFGAGMGLPNMKRYSDSMEVDSTVGVGTTITMVIKINEH